LISVPYHSKKNPRDVDSNGGKFTAIVA